MDNAPRPPDEPQAAARSGIRWDALAAIIASLVGLLALLVAGYTAYIQREQVRAQVWPYLQFETDNVAGSYDIRAMNKGVGPVIVRSVEVIVGGAPVKNWDALNRAIAFKPTADMVTGALNEAVLAPGDTIEWVRFGKRADVDAFLDDWAKHNVEARICYVSTLGESWSMAFSMSGNVRQSVPTCPVVPQSSQFSG